MQIFILVLLCLAALASVAAGVPENKSGKHKYAGFLVAQGIFCFFILVVFDFAFLSLAGYQNIKDLLATDRGMFTVEDLFYLSLFIIVQLIFFALLTFGIRAWNLRGIGMAAHSFSSKAVKGFVTATALSAAFMTAAFSAKVTSESKLIINEVCSKNEYVMADEDGNYGDYVELYNPSRFNISLSDFYMTDDLEKKSKRLSDNDKIKRGVSPRLDRAG